MSETDVLKLKKAMTRIAADYVGTLKTATIVHAKLEKLEPLTFNRDDDIELKE